MRRMAKVITGLTAITASFFLATSLYAAPTTVRVLGFWGNQPQVDDVDRPLWDSLKNETQGRLEAKYVTLNEAGIKGGQALRFLKKGAFDVMTISVSYVSGDEPSLVAVDLPGIAYDMKSLREVSNAYRSTMEERVKRFDGVLLSHWTFNPQIIFCKEEIDSISDLTGKKVRVSGAPAADTLKELGATAVNMTGGEVYQALQRGIVDCASTGTTYGFKNRWHEVTNYLYDLPLGGYSQVIHVANAKFWDSLSPEDQKMIMEKVSVAEDKLWAMAPEIHQAGITCLTGQGDCPLEGEAGEMKFVETSQGDKEKLRSILTDVVVPKWKESCDNVFEGCGTNFDNTIGKKL